MVQTQFIRWIFETDQEAAEAIKWADFGAYTGLDRGIFNILNDPAKSERFWDTVNLLSGEIPNFLLKKMLNYLILGIYS